MNGIHDMGGMDGFGAVVVEAGEPVFHHEWERRVFGLTAAMTGQALGPIDAFRFAIERMDPAHYLRATYYERWLTALATRLVETGKLTRAELDAALGGPFPLAQDVPPLPPLPDTTSADGDATSTRTQAPRFAPGDRVRVRNVHPPGHTRSPRYVRGKVGTIVRCDGAFPLADAAARGITDRREPAYGVRFAATELWGDDASPHDAIHVDLWESSLEEP